MKQINKKRFLYALFITAFAAADGFAFGQNADSEIALPEVTTEITTEDLIALTDDLPDFAQVINVQEGSGELTPELPEVDVAPEAEKNISNGKSENSIYGEGKIGGGYPIGLYGDFSIYSMKPDSPFKLSFLHDSASGYSRHELSEGYNDSTTSISLDKTFALKNNLSLGVNFDYKNMQNGLQNQAASNNASDVNQNAIGSQAAINWKFAENFNLGGKISGGWYDRYVDITGSSEPSLWTVNGSPEVYFNWSNYGFAVDVKAAYEFDKENEAVHRANTGLGFSWENDYVKAFGDAGLVFGNQLNENSVMVPFDAGVNLSIPVGFSNRKMGVKLAGGMDSYRMSLSDYELKYKFSNLTEASTEVSDWFGKVEVSVPVLQAFTASAKVEYRQTAFGNGVLEPVYDNTHFSSDGLYSYETTDRQNLLTDLNVVYYYHNFTFTAQWLSNWLYVPALQDASEINLTCAVQSKESKWNASVTTGFGFNEEGMSLPLISLSGFVKLSDSVNMVCSLEDVINLFGGKPRTYAGKYIARSGSAAVMIKFFF